MSTAFDSWIMALAVGLRGHGLAARHADLFSVLPQLRELQPA